MSARNPCCADYKVPYVIYPYDPTEDFTYFDVPTIWINKKTRKAFILTGMDNGKAIWQEIDLASNGIESLVLPDKNQISPLNGIVEIEQGEGIIIKKGSKENSVIISLNIPIKPSQGGTGQTSYEKGDLLVGGENNTLTKLPKGNPGQIIGVDNEGNVSYLDTLKYCAGEKNTPNAFVQWNHDGSCLHDSYTKQKQSGDTTTQVSNPVELVNTWENLSTTADTTKEIVSNGGKTILRFLERNKQKWEWYTNPTDKSYNLYGWDLEEEGKSGNYFRINKVGNVSHPLQYRALVLQTQNILKISGNWEEFYFGSVPGIRILKDIGKQFSIENNRLVFTVNEINTYIMHMHLIVNKSGNENQMETIVRIRSNTNRVYTSRATCPSNVGTSGIQISIGIDVEPGEKYYYTFSAGIGGSARDANITGSDFPQFTTYIGVICAA